jgi:hypothetical protein
MSLRNNTVAFDIAPSNDWVATFFAVVLAVDTATERIATRMTMMTMVVINSMSVKPRAELA